MATADLLRRVLRPPHLGDEEARRGRACCVRCGALSHSRLSLRAVRDLPRSWPRPCQGADALATPCCHPRAVPTVAAGTSPSLSRAAGLTLATLRRVGRIGLVRRMP